MASVDVLDEETKVEDVPMWIYKPTAGSDESIRNAAAVVSSDPWKYLLGEDTQSFKVKLLSEKDNLGDDTVEEEGEICFDFKNQMFGIKAPGVSVSSFPIFSIKFIHHVFMAPGKMRTTLMYQDGESFTMFHLLIEDEELNLVLIINAFRHSLFEYYKQFSKNNDDIVNVIDQCVSRYFDSVVLSVTDRQSHQVVFDSGECTVVLGTFFLCIFRKWYSSNPLYTVFFWQTPASMVVNNIVLMNETGLTKIESQEYAIEIPNATKNYPELLEAIKSMKPKSKNVFSDPDKFVSFMSEKRKLVSTTWKMPQTEPLWDNYGGTDQHAETRQRVKTFRDNMYVAMADFIENDQINLPWVMAETELKTLIDSGYVPETDIASGVIDNIDHRHCSV
ncbi:hypothetical protein KUTeg_017917, partial [Tegillarca granosa]